MNTALRFGLQVITIEKIGGVFAQFPAVEKAVLYGSRAMGNFKKGSDIDLTLYGEALSVAMLYKIMTALDDLLLPYMIDLSIFAQIDNQNLREHIERVGVVFYERNN